MHGIVHFDIPAKDLERQGAFYGELFYWKTRPSGDYLLVNPPEGLGGGLDPRGQAPVLYIEVEDIEAKLGEIEALGGKTVLPETVIAAGDGGDNGRLALFTDPEGNLLGLWSK